MEKNNKYEYNRNNNSNNNNNNTFHLSEIYHIKAEGSGNGDSNGKQL